MDTSIWFESLPEQCPPSDAFEPEDFVCYRLCRGATATKEDFLSHRELLPNSIFNAPECIARAVSVHSELSDSLKLKGLPAHREKTVFELCLSPKHGMIKKTGKASHYSWWRSSSSDPLSFAKKNGGHDESA
ncbi:hypothetical protein [Pseudomonas sp. PS02290]|uniref:hypothetical protein n=1 Tax=Pseudomonas sp. PS02290 TaxID=2991430 RepID=UPI00249C22A2|nr:hypothetical protein [Pseudomonas sp. PS02290]